MAESFKNGYAVEALGHSIFTGADTIEELCEMLQDAVLCHFEDDLRPKIIRLRSAAEKLSPHETVAKFRDTAKRVSQSWDSVSSDEPTFPAMFISSAIHVLLTDRLLRPSQAQ